MEPEPKSNSAVKLTIAVGKSRFDKDWKNTEMTWNELKEKLSHTTKTRETLAEFKGMSKARQDSIKDVGGFVGGTLKNGRRKAESVAWRQVVTLDMDEAPNTSAACSPEKSILSTARTRTARTTDVSASCSRSAGQSRQTNIRPSHAGLRRTSRLTSSMIRRTSRTG